MKEVIIIIRPGCYFKTKNALTEHRFFAMSTKEVLGRGRAGVVFSASECDKKTEDDEIYNNMLVAKKMISIVVPNEAVNELINVVLSVNSHNAEGDGKIFVLPVYDCVRIHTGETTEDALM